MAASEALRNELLALSSAARTERLAKRQAGPGGGRLHLTKYDMELVLSGPLRRRVRHRALDLAKRLGRIALAGSAALHPGQPYHRLLVATVGMLDGTWPPIPGVFGNLIRTSALLVIPGVVAWATLARPPTGSELAWWWQRDLWLPMLQASVAPGIGIIWAALVLAWIVRTGARSASWPPVRHLATALLMFGAVEVIRLPVVVIAPVGANVIRLGDDGLEALQAVDGAVAIVGTLSDSLLRLARRVGYDVQIVSPEALTAGRYTVTAEEAQRWLPTLVEVPTQ